MGSPPPAALKHAKVRLRTVEGEDSTASVLGLEPAEQEQGPCSLFSGAAN